MTASPRSCALLCCVALNSAISGSLSAQDTTTPILDGLIGTGDWVQVTIPGTIIESAVVRWVTADSLHVADAGQEWFLAGNRIQGLSVRQRKTRKFATGGFIGGALLGLVGQVFLNPVLCNERGGCKANFPKWGLISGGVFGVGFGVMGYHEYEWKPLIP